MKEEIKKLLPEHKKEVVENEQQVIEKFFEENQELRKAIRAGEKEGEYFIYSDDLKKIKCPCKRKNGKDYWEAFFILLGLEYCKVPRKSAIYLYVR